MKKLEHQAKLASTMQSMPPNNHHVFKCELIDPDRQQLSSLASIGYKTTWRVRCRGRIP